MWNPIEEALVRFLLVIDAAIYGFVTKLFTLFVDLTEVHIFDDSVVSDIVNRIYILVGIVALFIISYTLLNNIINPDNLNDKKSSPYKIVFNIVTSIILIILLPSIFKFGYVVQDAIVKDNIIGQLFLGTTSNPEDNVLFEAIGVNDNSARLKQSASEMSWSVFNSFFYLNEGEDPEDVKAEWKAWGIYSDMIDMADDASTALTILTCGGTVVAAVGTWICTAMSFGTCAAAGGPATAKLAGACTTSFTMKKATTAASVVEDLMSDDDISWAAMETFVKMGDFDVITPFAKLIVENESPITYTPILSTIAGLFLLYMIFSYCLDLGIRAVKLVFYQIIAPIPIMARIIPNNKMFNNWTKVTLTTFLEVFIRLFIIFTIVYLASNISEATIPGGVICKMIIILSIVAFARQAPKLFAEITGIDSGNMKLGIMEKLGAGGALAVGALIGGGVTAGVRNFTNSWKANKGMGFKRFSSSLKSGVAGAASGGFRSAKSAGFGAKSWSDVKNAASAGGAAAHKKAKDRKAYKASHPDGVLKGHISDAWGGVKEWAGVSSDYASYNERISKAQEFDIKKKVNDWVDANEATVKAAKANLEGFQSSKLNLDEYIKAERERYENLMKAAAPGSAEYKYWENNIKLIDKKDKTFIDNLNNKRKAEYASKEKELRKALKTAREDAIRRQATTAGSEIQQMVNEANRVRSQNLNDALFSGTRDINYATIIDDLNSNHETIFGDDKTTTDAFGNVTFDRHVTGNVETMRASKEYQEAFRRQKEKIEKDKK